MGGVSVLLMVAAFGITYGWQPDNAGGVEYVIQIEPNQLDALDRIGEISSTIDPAVRGHVSRVIIKVGTGPLPKITPPHLTRTRARSASDVMVVSDHSPVPIPEMEDAPNAIPIPGLDERGLLAGQSTAVMKPDSGDSQAGPGFTFPSLPSSLRDNSAATANRDPRLGAEAGARAIVPAPATRDPNRTQAPQFTGSDPSGQMAHTRPGGPSTDPTNSRDNSWRNFTSTNEFVGTRNGGPSTDPIGASSGSVTAKSGVNPGFGGTGVNGLSAGDTFGRMPGSLQTGVGDRASQERNLYPNNGNLGNANTITRGTDPNAIYSQYEQTQLDRQAEYARAAQDAARARSNAAAFQGNPQLQPNPPVGQSPDSRLTAAQVAAGAWTVDIYGRPLDRNGRLLVASAPSENIADRDRGQLDRYADRTLSSLGQPNPNPLVDPNAQANSLRFPEVAIPSRSPSDGARGTMPNANGQRWTAQTNDPNQSFVREREMTDRGAYAPATQRTSANGVAVQREADPPSLATRRSESALAPPSSVTTQPLLNGLLLISFVANVYLIFWMKNLRMQFRDLVAAKRMANSNSHAA